MATAYKTCHRLLTCKRKRGQCSGLNNQNFEVETIELRLFTDGSVDPVSKIGYGAYLTAGANERAADIDLQRIETRRFDHTSSAKLELQTFLWALGETATETARITAFTDSQNIIALKERREDLEKRRFLNAAGQPMKLGELYREFYQMTDLVRCTILQLEGHKRSGRKNEADLLFTLVDRASRQALRQDT